ncbi:MAG TPA: DUF3048 domain-containing protein [Candidatus Saccharibacteria bacterium]|nr:DUF3048 domain-containing protein [Candidatus Saccharibacteria bacterium]
MTDKLSQKRADSSSPEEPYMVEAESLPEISIDGEELQAEPKRERHPFIKKGPLSRREKIYFYSAIGTILLVGGGLLWWLNGQSLTGPADSMSSITRTPAVKYYSPLTGVEVADEAATKKAVIAVMIENSPDARPQSGLVDAEIVFEAVAEGGITRFIALYQTANPDLIGPVRSLRPYYADWAASFDPSVAHVGGSPEALTMIRSGNYGVDIDQFFNAGGYWRANDRYAPHNVYTSMEKLRELSTGKGKTSSNAVFSPRIDGKKVDAPNASSISIPISSALFNVTYDYDSATNAYARKLGGAAHTDREKGQIAPKVVIVLKTAISLAADGSHQNITTTGNGQAYVFQNGTVTDATWTKASAKERLIFKDTEGKEIQLVRGQTWITTVAKDKNVTWQ